MGMPATSSSAEDAFRTGFRLWLRRNAPRADAVTGAPKTGYSDAESVERARNWQRKLHRAGHIAEAWPQAPGDEASSFSRRMIVQQELIAARAPALIGESGLRRVAPLLLRLAAAEQRARFLDRIASGEDLWCIAEIEAGVSPETIALEDGETIVVSGRKRSMPMATIADWILCLARCRSAAPGSLFEFCWLAIPSRSPGVQIPGRPSINDDATSADLVFTGVRVPRENLIGHIPGWDAAKATADPEGQTLAADPTATRLHFDDLLRLARRKSRAGLRVLRDPVVRQRLAELATRLDAVECFAQRVLAAALSNRPDQDAAAQATRELAKADRDICRLALEILGLPGGLVRRPTARQVPETAWVEEHLAALARLALASPRLHPTSPAMPKTLAARPPLGFDGRQARLSSAADQPAAARRK